MKQVDSTKMISSNPTSGISHEQGTRSHLSRYRTYMQILSERVLAKHGKCFKKFKVFKDPPKFIYRKGKSIGNHLIRSDIREEKPNLLTQTRKEGTYPCLECTNCSSIIKVENIHHSTQGYNVPIRSYHTCNSDMVIYHLKCPCGKPNMGQTSY